MPYQIKRVAGGWSVVNKKTGKVVSKKTTLLKATAQVRLLKLLESKE
jgi:hypothetical protein